MHTASLIVIQKETNNLLCNKILILHVNSVIYNGKKIQVMRLDATVFPSGVSPNIVNYKQPQLMYNIVYL